MKTEMFMLDGFKCTKKLNKMFVFFSGGQRYEWHEHQQR